jgi:hypothetical protein
MAELEGIEKVGQGRGTKGHRGEKHKAIVVMARVGREEEEGGWYTSRDRGPTQYHTLHDIVI